MPDELPLSPDDFVSGRILPPGLMRDVQIIAALDESAVAGLAQSLAGESGILSEDRVVEIAGHFFRDDRTVRAVARTVQSVQPEHRQQIITLVDRWRHFSEDRSDLMPDDSFASLKRNLDLLVQDYPGVLLMRKAQRLLRDTSNEIDDALFVCDLRPVFDDAHEKIEGYVTIATLRIRYTRQNGDRDVFEIALTDNELSILVENGRDALQKLNVLKQTYPNIIR